MLLDGLRHRAREQLAVDGQRSPCRHSRDIGGVHDERVEPAHFLFEQADGIVEFVAAERIAADQLREPIRLVDFSRPHRPHLVDGDRNAEPRGLPGGFAPGQTAADNVDWAYSQIPNP